MWWLELQQLSCAVSKKATPKGWQSLKLEETWVLCDLLICHSSPGLPIYMQKINKLLSYLNYSLSSVYYSLILIPTACEAPSDLALILFLTSLIWPSPCSLCSSHTSSCKALCYFCSSMHKLTSFREISSLNLNGCSLRSQLKCHLLWDGFPDHLNNSCPLSLFHSPLFRSIMVSVTIICNLHICQLTFLLFVSLIKPC